MPPQTSATSTLPSWLNRGLRGLTRHLWIWPLLTALVFFVIGTLVRQSVKATWQQLTSSQLQAMLDTQHKAILHWLAEQEANARLIAADSQFRSGVEALLQRDDLDGLTPLQLAHTPEVEALLDTFKAVPANLGYPDFLVFDFDFRIVAGSHPELLSSQLPPDDASTLNPVTAGDSLVTPPMRSSILLPNGDRGPQAGLPTMFVVAPIHDRNNAPIAALACRMDPRQEFSEMLQLARLGQSGESYTFNRNGFLLSESRFTQQLQDLALLPNTPNLSSVLNLQLRDPGVDLRHSQRPGSPSDWPLTDIVRQAIDGPSAVNVDGLRDYRGVPVAAAWTWLDRYGFGLATKVDLAEIQQPFNLIRRGYLATFALLGLSAIALFALTLLIDRLQQRLRRAAIEARQLGQYSLDQEIGRGSNGTVFRARHAHLRRPVAVKLLNAEHTKPSTIERFEREVQATCRLTHPNTIVIYDYGRTPEDVFYYAMEYLEGLALNHLIEQYGPQPAGRVIHILRQACGSLAEAHTHGLIHRDIKPANLFLTQRGGIADILKVLDFGLVKATAPDSSLGRTVTHSLVGTPLYVSPESIDDPDHTNPQSDLYSLGAVGYFLLTGQHVFNATDLSEVLLGHAQLKPQPPSERLGQPIDADLEALILQCLEKAPALRPVNATALDQALGRCRCSSEWAPSLASAWWKEHQPAPEK